LQVARKYFPASYSKGRNDTMRTFILFWFDGTTNEIQGRDFSSACARHGYGSAFLQALEKYKEKLST